MDAKGDGICEVCGELFVLPKLMHQVIPEDTHMQQQPQLQQQRHGSSGQQQFSNSSQRSAIDVNFHAALGMIYSEDGSLQRGQGPHANDRLVTNT